MKALIRLFVKCAECETQQIKEGKINSVVNNSDEVNSGNQTQAPTEQTQEENEIVAKRRKEHFHNGVTFFSALGCFVFPNTRAFRMRIVEHRTRISLSLYFLGMVMYTQFLLNYFGLQHPPIKLLYENPREYNRLDNENMKFLWNEMKRNCSNLYKEWTKKESESSSETE